MCVTEKIGLTEIMGMAKDVKSPRWEVETSFCVLLLVTNYSLSLQTEFP